MLTLPRSFSLTPDQFAQVCAANPEAVLELAADGTVIEMTPAGDNTSARNSALVFRWRALSEAEREGFPPLCPDLVVELASPSDQLEPWRHKMASYVSSAPCVMPPGWRRLRSFPAW
jgi:Uma2 family endonuclease